MATLQEVKDYVEAMRLSLEQDITGRTSGLVVDYEQRIQLLRDQVDKDLFYLKDAAAARFASDKLDKETRDKDNKKSLTDRKGFSALPRYNGGPAEYEGWKLQMKTFLCETRGFHQALIELENMLEIPTCMRRR